MKQNCHQNSHSEDDFQDMAHYHSEIAQYYTQQQYQVRITIIHVKNHSPEDNILNTHKNIFIV